MLNSTVLRKIIIIKQNASFVRTPKNKREREREYNVYYLHNIFNSFR